MTKWLPRQPVTDKAASLEFLQYLASLEREISSLQARLDAVAAVAAPAGGATVDAQARTAINAIRTAAG